MYLYNAPRAHDLTTRDAAWWIAEQTGITPDEARARILAELVPAPGVVEEDAPLMAWWRRWAAEGGYRHA